MYINATVTAGKALVLDARQVFLVVRQRPTIEVSGDVLFGSDNTAVRCVSRFASAVSQNAAAIRVLTDV